MTERHPKATAMDPAKGSPWRSAGRFLVRRLRSGGGGAGGGEDAVGGAARLPDVRVRGLVAAPRRLGHYLTATGGAAIAALAEHRVLPPTFPAVWETGFLLDLLRLAQMPFPSGGIIHLASERVQLRPLAPREPAHLHLALRGIEPARGGVDVTISSSVADSAGRPASEGEVNLLLRGIQPQGRPSRTPAADRAPTPAAPAAPAEGWRTLQRWELPGSLGRAYARASGDINPIHLSRLTARPFGFPRPILHGYCTEAMVANALIEGALGGDPAAFARLTTRFGAPLGLPAAAELQLADGPGAGSGWFRVVDPARPGGRPYATGRWLGGTADP